MYPPHMHPLSLVGGRVGHPEAGPDRVCRLLCRDLQWRQQTETLHSYSNDWLPSAGAAGELANDEELMSPLFRFYARIYQ